MSVLTVMVVGYACAAVVLAGLLLLSAMSIPAAVATAVGCGSVGAGLLLLVWCGYDVVVKAQRSR